MIVKIERDWSELNHNDRYGYSGIYDDEYARIAKVSFDREAYVAMISSIFYRNFENKDLGEIFPDAGKPFIYLVFGRDDGNTVTPIINVDFGGSSSMYLANISYWFFDKILGMFERMEWDKIKELGEIFDNS
jgi:hypothetical protein